MNIFSEKNKIASSLFYVIVSALIIIFVTSCSQVTPELSFSDYSVIFDYHDETTLPDARFSLFMASESDVRRYERIKIKSLETGYIWDTKDIAITESENMQWAGCTNLVAPEDEHFPEGRYEITYYNADEKEYTIILDIVYDSEFYDTPFADIPDLMQKKKGLEKIVIFNKEKIVLYFGEMSDNFRTTRGIWNVFPNADSYQMMWYTPDGKVICIGPEKKVALNEE